MHERRIDNPDRVTVTVNHFSAKAAGEGRLPCCVTGGFSAPAAAGIWL
jgi:hypothetical protein